MNNIKTDSSFWLLPEYRRDFISSVHNMSKITQGCITSIQWIRFLFIKYHFWGFSFVSANHEIQCTMKSIGNKRNYDYISKPRIKMWMNIYETDTNENTWNHSITLFFSILLSNWKRYLFLKIHLNHKFIWI